MKGLVRASRSTTTLPPALDGVAGCKVVDRDGQELGNVIDILYDESHVERAYLEIESHHRLERKHSHFLAPVGAAALDQNPIVVSMSAKEQDHPPAHDTSMPLSEEYEVAVLGFWGVQLHQDVEAVRDPLVQQPGQLHSMRPEQFDSDPETPHSRYRTDRET